MTLLEMLVVTALSTVLMTVAGYLTVFSARSLQSIGNYSDLDAQSRMALDLVSREFRQGTALLAFQTNAPNKSLTLTNANAGSTILLNWNSDARTLVLTLGNQVPRVLLTECDRWDFTLYSRAPNVSSTNIMFYLATNGTGVLDPTQCKLINMSWKCSRKILGNKINTESVQTAQIVLRNKIR
jgi:hypothetical protein